MKSYNQFLLENNSNGLWAGTEIFDIEKAKIIFKEHCEDVKIQDTRIIRVVDHFDKGTCYVIDPSKYERKSAWTSNYYTLIINNSEIWKNYPKRKVICSIGRNWYLHGSEFGHGNRSHYRVIPFKNSKWGICKSEDIWESWPYFNKKVDAYATGDEINIYIRNLMRNTKHFDLKNISYSDLTKNINNIILTDDVREKLEYYMYKQKKLKPTISNMDILLNLMGPVKNEFELCNYKEMVSKFKDNEVWTDSKCLLISPEYEEELFNI